MDHMVATLTIVPGKKLQDEANVSLYIQAVDNRLQTQTASNVTILKRSGLARGHHVAPKSPKSAALSELSDRLWLIDLRTGAASSAMESFCRECMSYLSSHSLTS